MFVRNQIQYPTLLDLSNFCCKTTKRSPGYPQIGNLLKFRGLKPSKYCFQVAAKSSSGFRRTAKLLIPHRHKSLQILPCKEIIQTRKQELHEIVAIIQYNCSILCLQYLRKVVEALAISIIFSSSIYISPALRVSPLQLISVDHFSFLSPKIQPANAAGLVQLPPEKLNNSYWLVRAGESEWESSGIIHTNPVSKTNVESGLSSEGKSQSLSSARFLYRAGACSGSCWLWPSITQRSYQTAEIIAYVNGISYNRIVPEYSFLDARGLGTYEGKKLSFVEEVYEADSESPYFRPPRNTDGTTNESVTDVLVRVTQLLSITETQYSGESVVIISPDSDNLSVLQAAITGADLKLHRNFSFAPGEVREVTLNNVGEKPKYLSGQISFR